MFCSRKRLPHEVPNWVADGSRYFLTLCCRHRSVDSLCSGGKGEAILEHIRYHERIKRWEVLLAVIMPDHLHLIVVFGHDTAIQRQVSSWKSWLSKTLRVEWQSGFFEHRLRNDAEFTEKYGYVLENPVKEGLVRDWKDWPYIITKGSHGGSPCVQGVG